MASAQIYNSRLTRNDADAVRLDAASHLDDITLKNNSINGGLRIYLLAESEEPCSSLELLKLTSIYKYADVGTTQHPVEKTDSMQIDS